ncbi:MAG: hypothetical protein WCJ39_04575 [bacterium]
MSSQKDKKVLEALEDIIQQKHVSSSTKQERPPHQDAPGYLHYKKNITDWIQQHPERPPELGQAALFVLDTIAHSHENPSIIAKSLGKIMQIILNI